MIYLLCYDIATNSIRTKIAKRIIQEGFERIQKSVYLATFNPKNNISLWLFLQQAIADDKEASLFVIALTKNNFRSLKKLGNFALDIDYLLGEKHSLII